LLYVQAAPFIPNSLLHTVPFFVVPTLGTSLLVLGTGYWLVWAKVLPAFGYSIQHEIVQMPDGSERVKYKVSLCGFLVWGAGCELTRCRGSSRAGGGKGGDSGRGNGRNLFGNIWIGVIFGILALAGVWVLFTVQIKET
jgi:phosphatidylinositol 4-kinase